MNEFSNDSKGQPIERRSFLKRTGGAVFAFGLAGSFAACRASVSGSTSITLSQSGSISVLGVSGTVSGTGPNGESVTITGGSSNTLVYPPGTYNFTGGGTVEVGR